MARPVDPRQAEFGGNKLRWHGVLIKSGSSSMSAWQTRLFVLTDEELSYWQTPKRYRVEAELGKLMRPMSYSGFSAETLEEKKFQKKGSIPIESITHVQADLQHGGSVHQIEIEVPGRVYQLRAQSLHTAQRALAMINQTIKAHQQAAQQRASAGTSQTDGGDAEGTSKSEGNRGNRPPVSSTLDRISDEEGAASKPVDEVKSPTSASSKSIFSRGRLSRRGSMRRNQALRSTSADTADDDDTNTNATSAMPRSASKDSVNTVGSADGKGVETSNPLGKAASPNASSTQAGAAGARTNVPASSDAAERTPPKPPARQASDAEDKRESESDPRRDPDRRARLGLPHPLKRRSTANAIALSAEGQEASAITMTQFRGSTPLWEDWMEKAGGNILKKKAFLWRFFVLRNGKLEYWSPPPKYNIYSAEAVGLGDDPNRRLFSATLQAKKFVQKGTISLDDVQHVNFAKSGETAFSVETAERMYLFKANNKVSIRKLVALMNRYQELKLGRASNLGGGDRAADLFGGGRGGSGSQRNLGGAKGAAAGGGAKRRPTAVVMRSPSQRRHSRIGRRSFTLPPTLPPTQEESPTNSSAPNATSNDATATSVNAKTDAEHNATPQRGPVSEVVAAEAEEEEENDTGLSTQTDMDSAPPVVVQQLQKRPRPLPPALPEAPVAPSPPPQPSVPTAPWEIDDVTFPKGCTVDVSISEVQFTLEMEEVDLGVGEEVLDPPEPKAPGAAPAAEEPSGSSGADTAEEEDRKSVESEGALDGLMSFVSNVWGGDDEEEAKKKKKQKEQEEADKKRREDEEAEAKAQAEAAAGAAAAAPEAEDEDADEEESLPFPVYTFEVCVRPSGASGSNEPRIWTVRRTYEHLALLKGALLRKYGISADSLDAAPLPARISRSEEFNPMTSVERKAAIGAFVSEVVRVVPLRPEMETLVRFLTPTAVDKDRFVDEQKVLIEAEWEEAKRLLELEYKERVRVHDEEVIRLEKAYTDEIERIEREEEQEMEDLLREAEEKRVARENALKDGTAGDDAANSQATSAASSGAPEAATDRAGANDDEDEDEDANLPIDEDVEEIIGGNPLHQDIDGDYILSIEVKAVENIPEGTMGGSRDTYVTVRYEDAVFSSPKRMDSLNPRWDPPYTVAVGTNETDAGYVFVSVYDYDRIWEDAPVGDARLALRQMPSNGKKKSFSLNLIAPETGLTLQTHVQLNAVIMTHEQAAMIVQDEIWEYEQRSPLNGWSAENMSTGLHRFVTVDGTCQGDYFEGVAPAPPETYIVTRPWSYASSGLDLEGWMYAGSITADAWYSEQTATSSIRRRLWIRVASDPSLVEEEEEEFRRLEKLRKG